MKTLIDTVGAGTSSSGNVRIEMSMTGLDEMIMITEDEIMRDVVEIMTVIEKDHLLINVLKESKKILNFLYTKR